MAFPLVQSSQEKTPAALLFAADKQHPGRVLHPLRTGIRIEALEVKRQTDLTTLPPEAAALLGLTHEPSLCKMGVETRDLPKNTMLPL